MSRARQRLHHEHQPGVPNLYGKVVQERPQPFLARALRLGNPSRNDVGLYAVTIRLDQPKLGDVAADGCLGRPETAIAESGGEFLLGSDRSLSQQVADLTLSEQLDELHRGGGPLSGAVGR